MSAFKLRAGPPLPDADFASRHRGLLWLLAAHLVALPVFGVCMGWPIWEAFAVCLPAAVFGGFALPARFGKTARASACALGLLSCSAALVWLWHGTTEAHFHYFVIVGALALYEAALPYAIAFAFVVLQHGLMAMWVPSRVFESMAAMHDPWLWAGIHGGFVAALSLTQLVVWRASSQSREREQRASERALQLTGRFQRAFDAAPNGAALINAEGIILHANRALATSLRTTPRELVGGSWFNFLSDEDAIRARGEWAESLDGPEREYQVRRANGTRGWLLCKHLELSDLGEGAEAILQTVDVSRRRAAEANLMHQASHDSLTGLLNRRSFSEQVKNELAVVEPGQTAVLFIDIDDFKVINDSLGHGAGDELLVGIADRLRAVTRSSDLLGRFGGDEFVCCLTEVSADTVEEAAARVAMSLETPFLLSGVERQITVSIGLAMADATGDSIESLLRDADLAMYDAKLEGKDRTRWFDAQMRTEVIERRALEADLRHAIEQGEIVAHYQPQVDVRNHRVVGCEALARWTHPVRGEITPGSFIPLAERCGLIGPLTAHVLRLACTDAVAWRRSDPRLQELVVSVNLSPQAIDDELPTVIEQILEETGMPAQLVCLEVTETAVVDRSVSHITLDRLKQIGVRLAIDDFGVGQSSLSQLARLGRLDRLKIDKALIDEICESATASRVTQAIIDVARGDGLDIVAEGVEHPEQLEHLRELSCPIIQGWLYSKALVPRDFVEYATAGLSSSHEWSAEPATAVLPEATTTPR
ncbi:MAG TPA: EAL domain-containing protein [Solirubrobacteraceae bacterium]|nr:EAL domain-containing protein [Solirubrobacteraceae bacterium]